MTRNPLIFGLFTSMSLVEQVASGVPRIREEMPEAGLPVFSTDGGFFTVEFKRPQKVGTVNSGDDTVTHENGIVKRK
jgi:ATP-dependent DNA helicase RecG